MPIRACVFDAYGTLFDVSAAAREAAGTDPALAELWPRLARDWRAKQLQYTWHRAITGEHCDFWQVTRDALDWALEAGAVPRTEALRDRLLALYRELAAYPDVPGMLRGLASAGVPAAILSNGTPDMLDAAVASAGIGPLIGTVISVEEVGVFKPARAVYDLVGRHLGLPPGEVLFVSSNGWDAAAGAGYGFVTVWVNRAGEPVDRLPARPHHILPDLAGIPSLVAVG